MFGKRFVRQNFYNKEPSIILFPNLLILRIWLYSNRYTYRYAGDSEKTLLKYKIYFQPPAQKPSLMTRVNLNLQNELSNPSININVNK